MGVLYCPWEPCSLWKFKMHLMTVWGTPWKRFLHLSPMHLLGHSHHPPHWMVSSQFQSHPKIAPNGWGLSYNLDEILILHESMFTFLSDTSHEGLRGWSLQFNLMWQVAKEELITLGFIMAVNSKLGPGNPPNILHINMLEFMALSVSVWFALAVCAGNNPTHQQQHIGNFLSNNMLALSWMVHVGHAKKPHSCQLARFLQVLLTLSPVCF